MRVIADITDPDIIQRILDHIQAQYELKNPFRNGTTHILFSPLDFLSKLAALVPRPRHNLVRYHGIFAPNSKIRKLIVPKSSKTVKRAREEHSKTHKMAEEAARRDELVACPVRNLNLGRHWQSI